MITASTAIILDKRFKNKNGKYSVKLRITNNRVQKHYATGYHLSEEEWLASQQDNPRRENKEHKLVFSQIEAKALGIIKNLDAFSFELFEKKFFQNPESRKDLLVLMQQYIDKLKSENRLTTAESFRSALRSFVAFSKTLKSGKVIINQVTPQWLQKYETFMIDKGSSINTVGIYLRNLRAVFNLAIEEGIIDSSFYPFGKRKYQIPAGQNLKKALTLADIQKIIKYKPESKAEEKARDLWIFSYLCNGANIKDIALLQYKNINGSSLTFIRAKTARSTRGQMKPIKVMLLPEITAIIEKWGTNSSNPDDYVFGIISQPDKPAERLAKIRQATKTINKYIGRIGAELQFDVKLTTYYARHSFATVLKRSGAPIEFISESLGHKDLKTTENYLDSFEDDAKLNFQKKLLGL